MNVYVYAPIKHYNNKLLARYGLQVVFAEHVQEEKIYVSLD